MTDDSRSRTLAGLLLAVGLSSLTTVSHAAPPEPKFRVLVMAEPGGNHVEFSKTARPWLEALAKERRFEMHWITKADAINAAFLASYQLVLQLDFPPYPWPAAARDGFTEYIEKGKGGWVGLHHATLLGEFDGHPLWQWFSTFMGGIRFDKHIATFASATVRVEDKDHPCMKGVPSTFHVPKEEWYTYDKNPRPNVRVLANVDESSYAPASTIKMGDHPVVWTNERYPARNVYIFMGHGPDHFDNKAWVTLFRNSILWAAATPAAAQPVPAP